MTYVFSTEVSRTTCKPVKWWRKKNTSLGNPVPCPWILRRPVLQRLKHCSGIQLLSHCNQPSSRVHSLLRLPKRVASPPVMKLIFITQISKVSSVQLEKMLRYYEKFGKCIFWVSTKPSYLILYKMHALHYTSLIRWQLGEEKSKPCRLQEWGMFYRQRELHLQRTDLDLEFFGEKQVHHLPKVKFRNGWKEVMRS